MSLYLQAIEKVLPHDQEWKSVLPPSLLRRTPLIWQLSYAAAAKAVAHCPTPPTAIVCATALGALDETALFMDRVLETNLGAPRQFIASVHNSMAGVLAKEFNITGANLTLCDSTASLASALMTAQILPDAIILCIAVDEQTELFQSVISQCPSNQEMLLGEGTGAVAMILSKRSGRPLQCAPPTPDATPHQAMTFLQPALSLYDAFSQKQQTLIHCYSGTAKASATIMLLS